MKYYVGDRVIVKNILQYNLSLRPVKCEASGVVVIATPPRPSYTLYGVKLDKRLGNDRLNGMCRTGYGIWTRDAYIRLEKPSENRR